MAPAVVRAGRARWWMRSCLAAGPGLLACGLILPLVRLHGYGLAAWNTACENGTGALGRELDSGSLRSDCWMRVGDHVEGVFLLAGALLLVIGGCMFLGQLPPQRLPLRVLASVLVPLLLMEAGLQLAGVWIRPLAVAGQIAAVVTLLLFLAWLYCARLLAERTGWGQRLRRGWVIAGFVVPVVSLWFPFSVVADVWRASLPADRWSRRAMLPGWWWASWLTAQIIDFPGARSLGPFTFGPVSRPALVAGALSAVLTAAVVSRVSGRLPETAQGYAAPPALPQEA